ncbi:MinD-like ATPase involved in chromosome partitioning or flagellar assembly [Catenulispora sp. GP43]
MLVSVASVKGAPGATRLAMTLTALWPSGASPTLIEADAAGGTLAGRFGLSPSPSLTTLAAAVYSSVRDVRIGDHTQQLPGGLPVVVAPTDPAGVRAAVTDLAVADGLLERAAEDPDTVLVFDCGRLDAGQLSPTLVVADEVLLVVRPLPEMVGPLNAAIKSLQSIGSRVRVVLRGAGYDAEEMSRTLGVEVAGRLPEAPETGLFVRSRRAAYARSVQHIALGITGHAQRKTAAGASEAVA